jgi:hypothetical protein
MTAEIERPLNRFLDSARKRARIGWIGEAGLDDCKLVPAEPGDDIGIPDAAPQTRRDFRQKLVTHGVAERIVDALEVIEIKIEDRELRAAADPTQLLFEVLAEEPPVREIGQRIIVRELRDAFLSALALGDVVVRRNPPAVRYGLIHNLNRLSCRGFNNELGRTALGELLQ